MIKIGTMVGAPDLEIPTLAPYRGDLAAAFRKLARLGYQGVELMTRRPSRLDGSQIRKDLEENGLELAAICTGHVFGEDGLGLVGVDLAINRRALERLQEFIDFGAEYFGPGTLVNIGRSRGLGDPSNPEKTLTLAQEAFTALADYALPRGIRLILEPIRCKEANFIHSTQDGLRMARAVNRPNFGLMLDTFHMHNEDADLFASLVEARGWFWHVHFSDDNRKWPGNSQIDFGRIIQVLKDTGYNGYVSTEIEPWPNPDEAARASIEYLHRFLSKS